MESQQHLRILEQTYSLKLCRSYLLCGSEAPSLRFITSEKTQQECSHHGRLVSSASPPVARMPGRRAAEACSKGMYDAPGTTGRSPETESQNVVCNTRPNCVIFNRIKLGFTNWNITRIKISPPSRGLIGSKCPTCRGIY